MSDEQRLIGLDIETDTSAVSDVERARGFTSRGLDPRITPIVALSVAKRNEHGDLVCEVWIGDEAKILEQTQAWLEKQPHSILVTWNGSVFDLPFIDARARQTGVELDLRLTHDRGIVPKYQSTPGYDGGYDASWAGHATRDIAYEVKDVADKRGVEWSLKPFARSVGLAPVEVDRDAIHELDEADLRSYVASDAVTTLLLAERIGERRPGTP